MARLAWPPRPIRVEDELFEGTNAYGSVRYPCDWVDEKPGTDVVVVGSAHPPDGAIFTEMDVSVRVGRLFKAVRVHGPRVYQGAVFGGVSPGPPGRLGATPIQYEHAFGGVDDGGTERMTWEARNPAGVGYRRRAPQARGRAGAAALGAGLARRSGPRAGRLRRHLRALVAAHRLRRHPRRELAPHPRAHRPARLRPPPQRGRAPRSLQQHAAPRRTSRSSSSA